MREVRRRLGWTLKQTSEALGVHITLVQKWEAGTHQPPRYALHYLMLLAALSTEQRVKWFISLAL